MRISDWSSDVCSSDLKASEAEQLSLAAHYRRDKHVEWQQSFPAGTTEPKQTSIEDTYSIAAENRLAITPMLSLIAGASFDWRDLKQAEDRSEEHTSELQSLMRISYAVFCLTKKTKPETV